MKQLADFFTSDNILWRQRLGSSRREIALIKDGDGLVIAQLFNKRRVHFLNHSTVDDDKVIVQEIALPYAIACKLALAIKKYYSSTSETT